MEKRADGAKTIERRRGRIRGLCKDDARSQLERRLAWLGIIENGGDFDPELTRRLSRALRRERRAANGRAGSGYDPLRHLLLARFARIGKVQAPLREALLVPSIGAKGRGAYTVRGQNGLARPLRPPYVNNRMRTLPESAMADNPKIQKSDAEWRKELTPDQYYVTRQHGTERPFTSPLNVEKRGGVYACVACGTPLFTSDTKYESGSGWPSFWKPISPDVVTEKEDFSMLMRRVEIRCSNCDAHLGHVFPDGPQPTGLRYCMNGTALNFKPEGESGGKE